MRFAGILWRGRSDFFRSFFDFLRSVNGFIRARSAFLFPEFGFVRAGFAFVRQKFVPFLSILSFSVSANGFVLGLRLFLRTIFPFFIPQNCSVHQENEIPA
ncbi:MAG: hypothetical protein ACKVRN_16275 [Pyrinomonadaceae bacterium]